MSDESAFDVMSDGSDFAPQPQTKTKVKATKPAPSKKTAQPKAKPSKPVKSKATVPKKRVKDEEDDPLDASDHAFDDESLLADTPPKAKKQKVTANPVKSPHPKPLAELVNENIAVESGSPKASKKKRVSEQYQKLTQLEHIIKRPDTYIGSTEKTERQTWVFNSETNSMEFREISYVPGLFKIFDEILVNAADNKQNDANMKEIRVTIDREAGEISVQNDGKGIPVEIHSKEKVYIPELIFGHLLAGSNFDDNQQKVTGGRNGYGAKLCNIFSTQFTIETSDKARKKKYKQTWSDNMATMGKAKITDTASKDDYTKVTFRPDFAKFGMDGLDDDHESLFKRRVYDLCGTCSSITVYLNGSRLPVKGFKKYIEMYTKAIKKERGEEATNDNSEIITEKYDDRWEVGFTVSDGSFQQVSFVNSISTTVGGTHVNYIADQITNKLADVVKKKNKGGAALKPNQIRNHIFVFVNCLIVNPAFSSQTKEQLTTKASQFGSKCVISDEFMKKIVAKTDVITNILSFAQQKADQILKKSDGSRRSRMHDPKLTDANKAGSRDGHLCTLILTEGDSAKGMAMAGRAVVGADLFGVFPLRGKLLNVRDASIDQISKNKEIQNIKNFLGLQHKKIYTDTKGLRYGHLMIMTDQDHDGSHIKGLLINFLQVQFPSLLKIPNFLVEFITPIVKVYRGDPRKPTKSKAFYTMPEYLAWKEAHAHEKGWEHKYYKGLGTSSTEESQEYFNDLDRHHKDFDVLKDEENELIELAFSKKKADERKEWLRQFKPGTFFDYSVKKITYTDFINKELILFSMADNIRSLPSVIDGFKPTQRKVLYTCFKRNLRKDMKVVELAGLISGLTAYQHGDVSLQQTIVGLAQSFVGSNNVNCLEPAGQFGTRLQGGADAASARYIYTRLSPFARKLFHAADEPLLTYNTDDDKQIEPEIYVPVVPMVLINGSEGIGTGWSSSIPNHNPEEIVDNLRRKMDGEDFLPMKPWFRGFKGEVSNISDDRWKFSGIIKQTGDNEVEITELPVRVWTQDYKEKLEEIIKAEKVPSFIKDYKDYNTHSDVHFVIQMEDKHIKNALEEGLEERFKLSKTLATSNLVAFDPEGRITKYASVNAIMEEFYAYRLRFYQLRKDHMLEELNKELRKFTNQERFIRMIIEGKLTISRKKKPVLIAELKKLDFDAFPKKQDASKAGELAATVDEEEEDITGEDETLQASSYDYLLGMPLWSLTQERVDKLQRQIGDKEDEITVLLDKSAKDLWRTDLDEFIGEWRFQLEDEKNRAKAIRKGRRTSKKFGASSNPNGKKRKGGYDSEGDYEDSKPKKLTASKSNTAKKQAKLDFGSPNEGYVSDSKKTGSSLAKQRPPQSIKQASLPMWHPKSPARHKLANTHAISDQLPAPKPKLNGIPASSKEPSVKPEPSDEEPRAISKPLRVTAIKKSKIVDEASDSDDFGGDDPKPAPKPAAKPARAATTKKPKIIDEDSEISDIEADESIPAVNPPRTTTAKKSRDTEDSDSDDDLLAGISKRLVASSKPSTSMQPKPAAKKPTQQVQETKPSKKVVKGVDMSDTEMQDEDTAMQDQTNDPFDMSDGDSEPVKPVKKAAPAKKTNSTVNGTSKPKAVPKPVKEPVKKAEPKPQTQSPASKAYAKRLAKKKAVDSEDEDAMVDDILDSPNASDEEDESIVKPTARPARRAATTTKKSYQVQEDSEEDMDGFVNDDEEDEDEESGGFDDEDDD
ncbi:DNA topoisomerase 2 [Neophaeococcomyces mojaviensis]|uniref:DNA topoisomerase 2 n=1 Tax=Neophaeococcomyces mojaviensis TaxID=3383035 RepID=A0ACC3A3W3_9EURO|nr:DNA topoisomerase 2 [Knufia sp. JES_112]